MLTHSAQIGVCGVFKGVRSKKLLSIVICTGLSLLSTSIQMKGSSELGPWSVEESLRLIKAVCVSSLQAGNGPEICEVLRVSPGRIVFKAA